MGRDVNVARAKDIYIYSNFSRFFNSLLAALNVPPHIHGKMANLIPTQMPRV